MIQKQNDIGSLPMSPSIAGTILSPGQEKMFLDWYQQLSSQQGTNPNPNHPLHFYDLRGLYQSQQGVKPDPTDIDPKTGQARLHGSSQFKYFGHPTRFIFTPYGIMDRVTNQIIPQTVPNQLNNVLPGANKLWQGR